MSKLFKNAPQKHPKNEFTKQFENELFFNFKGNPGGPKIPVQERTSFRNNTIPKLNNNRPIPELEKNNETAKKNCRVPKTCPFPTLEWAQFLRFSTLEWALFCS